jgi:porin
MWPTLGVCLAAVLASPQDVETGDGFEAALDEVVATPGAGLSWRGLTFEMLWSQDLLRHASGGAKRGWSRARKLDLSVFADLEAAADMEGASAYVRWYGTGGARSTSFTGDLQTSSNIEAERRNILADLWIEQRLVDDRLSLKLGKMDANAEFATVSHGAEFINSPFGYSPNVLPLPTFPDPAFGFRAQWAMSDRVAVRGAVFDGSTQAGEDTGTHGISSIWSNPVRRFYIAETELGWGDDLTGRAVLGGWRHDGTFAEFDGGADAQAEAVYLVLEQELWARTHDDDRRESLATFVQLAQADEDVSPFAGHQGGGLVWWDFEPGHALGVGLTRARLSREPGAGFTKDAEIAWEAWWRWQATERLVVKPDVQYITHPGGAGLDDALMAGLRLEWRL